MTGPQQPSPTDRSDADDDIEQHACPKCDAQPGSPCGSRGGAVPSAYHNRRFTMVPRLSKVLRVPTPADRGPGRPRRPGTSAADADRPGPAERGHPYRLRPLLDPRAGTRLPVRRAHQARHPEGQDLQREDQHPRPRTRRVRGRVQLVASESEACW
ncbi:zinc finger domain-containing protein [Streptomyces tendae]